MQLSKRILLAMAGGVLAVSSAFGGPVSYLVTVNTTTQTGNTGYIDLQFNPAAGGSQTATMTVSNFSTDGTLLPADPLNFVGGNVTGSLPGNLVFQNDPTTNEYTEALMFQSQIKFDVTFDGPAIETPSGGNGSTFALDFLDSTQSSYLFTADPTASGVNGPYDYFGGIINVNGNGSTTPTTFPDGLGNYDVTITPTTITTAPEPTYWWLVACTIATLAFARRGLRRVS